MKNYIAKKCLAFSDVLRYFLFLESGKTIRDDRVLEQLVRSQCFHNRQVNPFGVWTLGYKTDRRNEQIVEWVEISLSTKELCVTAVDPIWNPLLRKWNGNLRDCSKRITHGTGSIHPEKQKITVVQKFSEKLNGEFEVIDGFHRSMLMLSEGTEKIDAIVGLTEATYF